MGHPARYYDFNVWSERKFVEKLKYIHRNPVRRGLVVRAEDWNWSSFGHYLMGDRGPLKLCLTGRRGFGRALESFLALRVTSRDAGPPLWQCPRPAGLSAELGSGLRSNGPLPLRGRIGVG